MTTVIYDLHTHSTASDGTLKPAELVRRAAGQGVNVLALTDHDCTAGLTEASVATEDLALNLIPGVEISVTWGGRTVHILGLGINQEEPGLQAGLQKLRSYRDERAREIAHGLQKAGIEGALEGASCYAQGSILSRTHFARFLVARGYAKNTQAVFKRYLAQGKPGYVAGCWATLEQAVGWIRQAGGCAVVAHPARYHLTRSKLVRLFSEFKECGGVAMEVLSGSQPPEATALLLGLARDMELLGSCGSDYHGPGQAWVELGRIPPLPGNCKPVWSLWQ
ncbi:PHP domain-containing protein [Nitrosococcus watsonii]|uniref:PHP domain protein n=1 Tax=Nitrosococcus watsoni (strain C-113) TaxID=105559 RepID=D8K8E2_NITWC|nr:PHP domain-containing protein [Nitrosococcus watsonii]ADJ29062.1 PHP domain protein [Nitrosococcus watsonii C-113]